MNSLLIAHIIAGALGLVSGFVALSVAKGGEMHLKSGMFFVYVMVSMAIAGSVLAGATHVMHPGTKPGRELTVLMGVLTTYLVVTALWAVRSSSTDLRRGAITALLVAAGVGILLVGFGFAAFGSPLKRYDGLPAIPYFVFGSVSLLAAGGDFRVLRTGPLVGAPRLARHLWRMCFALFIAALSVFVGQAKVFPVELRVLPVLAIPPIAVLVVMSYWLWRIRIRRVYRGLAVAVRLGAAAPPMK